MKYEYFCMKLLILPKLDIYLYFSDKLLYNYYRCVTPIDNVLFCWSVLSLLAEEEI